MPVLSIILDGDGALKEERDRVVEGEFTRVLTLDSGMASGKPSVGVVVELPDGTVALGQTSLGLFLMAADAFKAKHGDPRLDEETKGGPS
jgi:hypothetical protein